MALLTKVTQRGYHGRAVVEFSARDGAIYAYDQELKETMRAG